MAFVLHFLKKSCIGGDSTLYDILQQIYTCIAISRETVIIEPTIFFPDGLTVFDILFGGSVVLSLASFFTWSDSEFDD